MNGNKKEKLKDFKEKFKKYIRKSFDFRASEISVPRRV